MVDKSVDEVFRHRTEVILRKLSEDLCHELEVNEAQKKPGRKVTTATIVLAEDGRFLAMDGSAHQMGDLFVRLLQRRPELRIVLQEALDKLYKLESR